METVENRKRFTHRSHSLRSPSFSALAFSLYKDKCPFFYSENVQLPRRTEGSVSIWQRKANGTQAVLSSKKAPKHDNKTQHHAIDVMLGF